MRHKNRRLQRKIYNENTRKQQKNSPTNNEYKVL